MAKTPILDKKDYLALIIKAKGKEIKGQYVVRSVEVTKEVNRISYAEIVIRDGQPAEDTDKTFDASQSADFIPGVEIEILAGYGAKTKSIFKGVVVSQRLRIRASGANIYVKCADEAVAMTIGRKSQYFLKAKDSDIISKVTKPNGVTATVKATSIPHPEVIQYHATDWDFVLSRAEVNGYIVLVDEGKLTIEPPKLTGSPAIKLTYGLDIISFDAEIDARTQFPSVTCNAWDMKTQKMVKGESKEPSMNKQGNLKGKTLAGDIGIKKPVEFHTSGAVTDKMLKEWANARLLKSRLACIQGDITFAGSALVKPGVLIELAGLGKRYNGDAFVSRVHHVINDGEWITHARMGLSDSFFVEQRKDVPTLPAAGLLPPIHGLQIGVVQKIEADPDKEYRILVDIPVIKPSGDGVWARLSNFYATNGSGLFFMPEVKDEVIVGFINDDPRFPVILGMVYSSKLKPAYEIDKKNNIKALVTKSKMKIEFEEEKKIITIETPGGNTIIMDDDKKSISMEDPNKNSIVMDDKGITLKTNKDISLVAKGKVAASGDMGAGVMASSGDVTLDGINIKATGDGQVGIQGAMTEVKGSGQVTIKGAMVMIN